MPSNNSANTEEKTTDLKQKTEILEVPDKIVINIPKQWEQILDISNPVTAFILFYLGKKIHSIFKSSTNSITQAHWFSAIKDEKINTLLQRVREAIRCDRIVLGLITNGDMAVGTDFHVRKLAITHESCGAGIEGIQRGKTGMTMVSSLSKELSAYGSDNYISKTIKDVDIDSACRSYLDSINCEAIYTVRLSYKVKGQFLDLGFLSLQWKTIPDFTIKETKYLDALLQHKEGKDLLFFVNQITNILIASKPRIEFLTKLSSLIFKGVS